MDYLGYQDRAIDENNKAHFAEEDREALDSVAVEIDAQPLLESVRSLVEKEKALAKLQVQELAAKYKQLRQSIRSGSGWPSEDDEEEQQIDSTAASLRMQPLSQPAAICAESRPGWLDLHAKGLDNAQLSKLTWIKGLTAVDLSHNKLSDTGAGAVGALVHIGGGLRSLDLSHNSLGAVAVASVLDACKRKSRLQNLNVAGNLHFASVPTAGADIAQSLLQLSGPGKPLWGVSLTLNDFETRFGPCAAGAAAAAAAARSAPVKAKRATGRREHPMNALTFVKTLFPKPAASSKQQQHTKATAATVAGGITVLGLPYAALHKTTVVELVSRALPVLTSLDLSGCYIGPAGALAIARAITPAHSTVLVTLLLQHNAVGNTGAKALAAALSKNRVLTALDLSSNGISDAGAAALCRHLVKNPVVTRLAIGGSNPLTSQGASLLVETLSKLQLVGLEHLPAVPVAVKTAQRRLQAQRCQDSSSSSSSSEGLQCVAEVPEAVSAPVTRCSTAGFVQVQSVLLDADALQQQQQDEHRQHSSSSSRSRSSSSTLQVSWWCRASPSCGAKALKWRVTRRSNTSVSSSTVERALKTVAHGSTTTTITSSSSSSAEAGLVRCEALCSGWRNGDELALWLAPCSDAAGTAVIDAAKLRSNASGELTVQQLRVSLVPDNRCGLLYSDYSTSDSSSLQLQRLYPVHCVADTWFHIAGQMPHGSAAENALPPVGTLRCLREMYVPSSSSAQAVFELQLVQQSGLSASTAVAAVARRCVAGCTWAVARVRAGTAARVVQYGRVVAPSTVAAAPMKTSGVDSAGTTSISSVWSWCKQTASVSGCAPGDVLALWLRIDLLPEAVAVLTEVQRRAVYEGIVPACRHCCLYSTASNISSCSSTSEVSATAALSGEAPVRFAGVHCMSAAATGLCWQ
jgi:Leucine Rich repeat